MPQAVDITGRSFGRLEVLGLAGRDRLGQRIWNCKCACGSKRTVIGKMLLRGSTVSCGCYASDKRRQRMTRHGMSHTPEYGVWVGMIARCKNKKGRSSHRYVGRGISVCKRWQVFKNFFADMGERPSPKHSIDRYPDNDGNYEPGNCRWATDAEQQRNKSTNRFVVADGRRLCVEDWAELSGLHPTSILHRLDSGWNDEDAVSKPAGWTPPAENVS